jgi:hypothetical protein
VPSYEVAANVARMLHEDGITPQEAESYLREWGLDSPERAAKSVEFLTDPGSWAYITAYTDGRRLCRSFMDLHPDGFRRLLTEQVTVCRCSSRMPEQGGPGTGGPQLRSTQIGGLFVGEEAC